LHTKKPTAIICLSPNDGGMEIDAIKLADKLSLHSEIILIAKENSFISQEYKQYSKNKYTIETVNFHNYFSLSIIFGARNIIKKYSIKNVIFFGASELRSLYFSFLGLDINLIIRHGTTKSKPKKDFFHKLIYSNVNYHVSICKHLEDNVKHIIPFGKNSKSILIYSSINGVTPPTKNKNSANKLTLLHVGRIAKAKGQLDAIKACEILDKKNIDFELLLVGSIDDNYRGEFLDFLDLCPYKDKIKLTGFTNQIEKYYKQADIFLFPSHGEGLSNAFLEALSYGLLAISYNNTSFPELYNLGFTFFMAENKNLQDLQNQLFTASQGIKKAYMRKSLHKNQLLMQKIFSQNQEVKNYLKILA
jgi:glycosyltransferase involved in cell wall biosynthesis